jgi:transposase
VGQVAKDFDLTETAVREWVKQAERDAGTRDDGGLTSSEKDELAQLRRETAGCREDVDILKRATVECTGPWFRNSGWNPSTSASRERGRLGGAAEEVALSDVGLVRTGVVRRSCAGSR